MPALSFSVLHSRDFRLLLLTRMFVIMGLQTQSVIVGWQVYSITKSTLMLGFTGLTEAIPAITCALFAGHIVDISRPHRVYMGCLATLALNTLMLYLLPGGVIHRRAIGSRCCASSAGIFISGIARSFAMPSSFSLLPQIVSRGQITSASALAQ